MAQVCALAALCALTAPLIQIPVATALQIGGPSAGLTSLSVQDDDESWPLWPAGEVPGELEEVTRGPEVYIEPIGEVSERCAPGDKTMAFYNVTQPALYPFLGNGSSNLSASMAMLVLPGGGFDYLAWIKEGTDIAVWLNSLGYPAFVLKYRVPPREWITSPTPFSSTPMGAAVMDGRRAVRMIRHSLPSGVRVGAIGFSAGGALASTLAYGDEGESQRPHFDDVDEESALLDFQLLIYGANPEPYMNFDFKTPPPTFMAGAIDDQCVPAAVMAESAVLMRLRSGSVELHTYADGRHGYGRCALWVDPDGGSQDVCHWPADAAVWLSNLANPPARTNLALAGKQRLLLRRR